MMPGLRLLQTSGRTRVAPAKIDLRHVSAAREWMREGPQTRLTPRVTGIADRWLRARDHSGEMRTSRSFAPFAGPTSPRRAIASTIFAARLYPTPSFRWIQDVEQRRV